MALSTDQFQDQLIASGLLTAEDVASILSPLPADKQPQDGEQLARELVRQKKLTKFQAEQIYLGKGKSLVLGNYTILDKLGQGGMGMVLKAEHKRLKRLVALKVLSPAALKTPDALKRFHREVEAAAKLRHTNVVATDDADEAKGTHFLVMEYVEGSDLSALVKRKGPLSVSQALQCILQAARGLEYAHEQGVVHRDIKPANLLLDAKGTVKILDMGLARIEGDSAGRAELTSTGAVMGTVDYMAPEQALSTKTADARSDIYSLGISLWYLLTGKCAYDGDTLMAKLLAHRDASIPSLTAVRNEVSAAIDAVFQKMVAKQAKNRYQSMTDVIRDLEACQSVASSISSLSVSTSDDDANPFSFLNNLSGPASSVSNTRPSQPSATRQLQSTATDVSADAAAEATMLSGDMAQATDPQTLTSIRARSSPKKRSRSKAVASLPWWQDRRVQSGGGATVVLLLLAVVFLFQTPNGTLRVEILDPEVEMRVKGTELTFHGSDLEPVSLKAGEKKLMVTRGDLSFETEGFTLKKGTETRVKVELLDDKLIVNGGGKVIAEQSIKRKGITTSTTGSDSVASKLPTSNGPAPPSAIAPFDAAQAKAHQEAWAKYLGVPVEYTNSIGMKFRLIPPGEFTMGSTPEEIEAALKVVGDNSFWRDCILGEAPQHKVILTQPHYLGMNEVTQDEYEKVMGTNPSHFSVSGPGKDAVVGLTTARHPVEMVSWNDAAEFCVKLSQREQFNPFYLKTGDAITSLDGTGYRLPTEAEWEYACRAGTTTKYWSGEEDEDLAKVAWFVGNSGGRTHAAGELKANPFGLFDILGNVWEWGHDGWNADRYRQFQKQPAIDPHSPFPASPQRAIRGGVFDLVSSHSRASGRNASPPTSSYFGVGFRISLPVAAVREALKGKSAATSGWSADAPPPPPAIVPFDAAQAKRHQEAWAAYLKVPVEYTNSIGMKFRLIPPGEFLMGIDPATFDAAPLKIPVNYRGRLEPALDSAAPRHRVTLTRPYYLQTKEVNVGQFERLVRKLPPGHPQSDPEDPLQSGMMLADAVAFCNALSQHESKTPAYQTDANATRRVMEADGYRLPTEAEWEFACRAGTITAWFFGDVPHGPRGDSELLLETQIWLGNNRPKPNPFGLYAMYGSSTEYCYDRFAPYDSDAAIDPFTEPGKTFGVLRGGTMYADGGMDYISINSFARDPGPPDQSRTQYYGLGRVVLPIAVKAATATPSPTVSAAASGKLFVHDTAFPQWVKGVQAMPAEKQIEAVSKKLVELNPGFDGKLFHHVDGGQGQGVPKIENGVVTELHFYTDKVIDLSPVRAFSGLKTLSAFPTNFASELTDLAPLQGMQLTDLLLTHNSKLSDISPLKGIPLTRLRVAGTEVSDLTPIKEMPLTWLDAAKVTDLSLLQGMKLTHLGFSGPISDLKPLQGMPLEVLQANHTAISDLSPLKGMPLTHLELYGCGNISDVSSLHDCKSLKILRLTETKVTAASVAALQKALPDCKIEWVAPPPASSGKLFMHDPAFPQWVKDVQAMSVEEQVEAVSKKLVELNPGFDGTVGADAAPFAVNGKPKAENGVVTQVALVSSQLLDLSPLRALAGLKKLTCHVPQGPVNGILRDLSPLTGMQLTSLSIRGQKFLSDLTPLKSMPLNDLDCSGCKSLSDLTPLQDMALTTLNLRDTPIVDLSPLRGMNLKSLELFNCRQLDDLSPLKEMKLESFIIGTFGTTKVWDLSVLAGMPLKEIQLPYNPERDKELLRSIKTLERINFKPSAEFLENN